MQILFSRLLDLKEQGMCALQVEPLHEEFGATVRGIDLKQPLSESDLAEVRKLIDDYSFVYFPDQFADDDQQLAVTRALGEPEPNHVTMGETGRIEFFGTIGNVLADGSTRGNDDRRTRSQTANNMWHSDSSFRRVPSYVSLMSAHIVPEEGGETIFASARSAYDRLSDAEKAELEPLRVVHHYRFSRTKAGDDVLLKSHDESLPPVEQKMVRVNPGNGRKNYYVGSHAKIVVGWEYEKSRELIDELLEKMTGPEHEYSHRWKAGDFVIWDNRCLLHRGAGYDADKYRRYMRQTRVTGVSTLEE